MKKFLILLSILFMLSNAYAAEQWREDGSEETVVGTESPSDIDTLIYDNIVAPAERLLSNYRQGLKISYASASSLTVGAGEVVVSNSGGTARLMLKATSSTTVNWSNIDTGSEAASTTYYLYAGTSTTTDTSPTFYVSTSSSAPTSVTYYKRLGSFYNDSSSNITYDDINNDNDYYALQLGDWVSKSENTTYQATTDGIACCYYLGGASGIIAYGYTDSSSSPTTLRANATSSSNGDDESITFPVRRGDYWKCNGTNESSSVIYWIPLSNSN